jgi:uncharacterized iron-regulated membrane protein
MRRFLYRVHLYAGLILGGAVAFVGLTGSSVVYLPEIERLLYPEKYEVALGEKRLPLDALVPPAVAAYPGVRPSFVSVDLPLAPDEPLRVLMKDFSREEAPWWRVHVDPYTGEALASFDPEKTLTGFLFHLHANWLTGEHRWGERAVGWIGVALLVFCATGLILWWPGWRRLSEGFRTRASKGGSVFYGGLHRVLGFAFTIPLLLIALTGLMLVFPEYTRAPIVKALGVPQPPRPPRVDTADRHISLEVLQTLIQREFAEAKVLGIRLPPPGAGLYTVRLLQRGDERRRYGGGASLLVWVEAATGRIVQVFDWRSAPLASRALFFWLFPTHTGDIAGAAGRLIAFFSGLVPSFLLVTGWIVWYFRRARRQRPTYRAVRAGGSPR